MSLPDYKLLMLPSLQTLADGVAVRVLASEDLMDEDIRETNPRGRQPKLTYYVNWAVPYREGRSPGAGRLWYVPADGREPAPALAKFGAHRQQTA